tara:strand:- start:369 stop:608 length:240 start_codon:yes stop_codon:yes gene_type:complete
MKDKNFQNNIELKSLEELTIEVNKIIENLEKEKNLENSTEDYQKLIKLNNIIEKKFQAKSKNISLETKNKISKIIKKND